MKRFYEFDSFRIDAAKRLLLRAGQPVPLTPKAFDTLLLLVENGGQVMTKDDLMTRLWPETFVEEGSLTRNISALRKALGENPREHRYIVTIPGEGYRFVARVRGFSAETGDLTVGERTRTSIILTEQIEDDQPEPRATEQPATEQPATGKSSPAGFFITTRTLVTALILMAAAISLVVVVIGLIGYGKRDSVASLALPKIEMSMLTTTGNIIATAISPDGKYVTYSVQDTPKTTSLWVRQIATHTHTQLLSPAEVDYYGMTISPDGNYIYYIARPSRRDIPSLYRMALLGGPSKKILDDIDSPISFSPTGRQFVFRRHTPQRREMSLIIASPDDLHQEQIAAIDYPEGFGDPSWSPDGRVITCAAGHAGGGQNRYMLEYLVDDRQMRPFTSKKWRWIGPVCWLSDSSGLLMIANETAAEPSQVWHLAYPSGEARRVTNDANIYSRLSVTTDSNQMVATQTRQVTNVWIIPRENPHLAAKMTFGSGGYRARLWWTRDARIVYESSTTGSNDLSIMNEDGSSSKQLLGDMTGRGAAFHPVVTPDGQHIIFAFDLSDIRHIWRMNIDGSNTVQLTKGNGEDLPSVSPDGRWLIYTDISSDKATLWRIPIDGGEPQQLTEPTTRTPSVSPDGKLIACFYLDEQTSGQYKLALIPFEGGKPIKIFPQPVSNNTNVRWTPDGRALTYVSTDKGVSNVWLQPVEGGPPEQLTQFTSDLIFGFGWSPDGKRLACVRGIWERNLVLISNFR